MRAALRALVAAFNRQTPAVRVELVIVVLLALAAGVLSWDALRWAAGEVGIDPALTWIYPFVFDGVILGATVGLLALRSPGARAYMWLLVFAGLGASVVGNGAHASGGAEIWGPLTLHRVGSAAPALALAAMLHTLLLLVRPKRSGAAAATRSATSKARPRGEAARRVARLVQDGAASTAEVARRARVSERYVRRVKSEGSPAA